MELTIHKVKKVPNQTRWSNLKFDKPVIYTGDADGSFKTYLQNKGYNFNSFYDNHDNIYWYSYDKSGESNFKLGLIVLCKQDQPDINTVKGHLIELNLIHNEFKVGLGEWDLFLKRIYNKYKNIKIAEKKLQNARGKLRDYSDEYQTAIFEFGNQSEIFKNLQKYKMPNGIKLFEYEDVIAEDTCCEGEDIYLGKLVFEVNFLNNTTRLIEGTHSKDNSYCSTAYHPHHLNNDPNHTNICLGSQEADMAEAIINFEFGLIQAMLHKFAHSYTSSDSAGQHYTKWLENYVYLEYCDKNYPEEECHWSEHSQEWIHQEDAVWVSNIDSWVHEDITTNDYKDDYILSEEAVYSNYLNVIIHEDDVITTECGNFVYGDYEHYEEYDGKYYLSSEMVDDINGDRVPANLTTFSNELNEYVLTEDVVEFEGGIYTEDTLPKVEETVS